VVRAERDEKFRVTRNAPRGLKVDRPSFPEGEKVALRVPDIFIHKAVGKEGCPGVQGERGVICCDDEAMADIEAVHVKGWRCKRRTAQVPVLKGMDPSGVAAQ
jgi:hypothetical protein